MEITVVIPSGLGYDLEVLESLKNQDEKIKKIIVIRGKNPSRNRNRGIKNSKTELIAFANSHSSFPNDWSKNVREFFEMYPWIDIVGGPQLTPDTNNFFGKISGYALSSKFGAANVSGRYGGGKLKLNADETDITSSNLICKKKVFEKIKWNETIYPGEDPKFIEDAKKTGFKVAFSGKIVGYNKRREDVGGFLKQIFNYGLMRTKKENFLKTLKMPLFLVPSVFVLYLVFLIEFGVVNFSVTGNFVEGGLKGSILILPLVLYTFLSLLFAGIESVKNKNLKAVFVLPFVFPLIHISYGIGMLWGWLRK